MNKTKKNDREWVWCGIVVFLFIVVTMAIVCYTRDNHNAPSKIDEFSFNEPMKKNNVNYGSDISSRNNNSNRGVVSKPRYRPKRYNRYNNDDSMTQKGKEAVGTAMIALFFFVVIIIWALVYTIKREFLPESKPKEEKSHLKLIFIIQGISFLLCCILCAYNEEFVWGIVLLVGTMFISLCVWAANNNDYNYQYGGRYISYSKEKPIRVKQKYRLQIFLNGAWSNTGWGGNDKNVVISRAKDILETNSWNINKVRVRKGDWKGEIIKEFAKKNKIKLPVKKLWWEDSNKKKSTKNAY